MRRFKKYSQSFALGFETAMEYRFNFLLSLISAVYPVIIQSFMWTAIFQASGQGTMYGYTYRQMMAYTFLAGLVSRIVRTGFEYEIMEDIKNGKFSRFLVQPLGYFPYRLSAFLGEKSPQFGMVLIIMALVLAGLSAVWNVPLEMARVPAFLVTLILAVALNFVIFYCFSAVSFWIVEIGFLFEGIRIITILLSGGIFPLEVFGPRFVLVTNLLPFKYTVSYPINVLNGRISGAEVFYGMGAQCVWIVMGLLLAAYLWRIGDKRYVAVGG